MSKIDKKNYSNELKEIIRNLSLGKKPATINGSAGKKGIYFYGDIDLYEDVRITKKNKLAQRFISNLKDNAKRGYVLKECKLGIDEKMKIDNLKDVDRLYKDGLITAKEKKRFTYILKGHYGKYHEEYYIKTEMRLEVLRWSYDELIKGKKELRGGGFKTLEECLMDPAMFKCDYIIYFNDQLIEFSIIHNLIKNGKYLYDKNKPLTPEEYNKMVEREALVYINQGLAFKYLKRIYLMSTWDPKQKERIKQTIFNGDLGALYKVINVIENIEYLAYNESHFDNQFIKDQLDKLLNLLNRINIKEVNKYINSLKRIIDYKKDTKLKINNKLGDKLDKIYGGLMTLLNKKADEFIIQEMERKD